MIALLLAAQVLLTQVSFPSRDADLTLTGTLYESSEHANVVPAVVLLHTCGGLDSDIAAWGSWFAQNGYAALAVDSFHPRNVEKVCGTHEVPPRKRAFDAYAALAYLRTRSEVDGARIGVVGFSHGGGAVLFSENASIAAAAGFAKNGFAASVAFYPSNCDMNPSAALINPLLVLIGKNDNWTDAATCEKWVNGVGQDIAGGTIHIYPGAYHKFDDPAANRIVHIGSHAYTLQYDADAAADAHQRVLDFLTQALNGVSR